MMLNKNNGYAGLGITASTVRRISDGKEYEALFPPPDGTDPIVNNNAEVHDTLAFVAKVATDYVKDTAKIAKKLKTDYLPATLKNIFDFFYKNYQYKLDAMGVEQVRRPARAWADRKSGIDCDCFATSVSSILLNLEIPHSLKIIAINGRKYYQHIYVVVPKFKGADLNVRSNYWVIDPVLNSFNEEAPKITKSDYLKMNGIPLQFLNGAGAVNMKLGKEFDSLETSLNGLDDMDTMEGLGFARFKKALHAHVRNTRKKIEQQPSSVEAVYNPAELGRMYRRAEEAFTKDDATLMGVLEDLSREEDNALQGHLRAHGNAIHRHDDHLYAAAFGNIDDNMINAFSGLGKKDKSAKKTAKAAKKGKSGVFTKLKNAVKKAKAVTKKVGAGIKKGVKNTAAKAKKGLKKIGKAIVKFNPVSLAARAGFLVAMRTNFGMIAEKAYWAYQTKAFAASKGINADYYDRCVQLLNKIRGVYIKVLKGEESALKKAIINGRAAKKVGKQLKKRGMSGVQDLMGMGGLGVVAAATVTTALSFLAPLVKAVSSLFKGKKAGTVENENGTDSPAPSEDPTQSTTDTANEAADPSDTINTDDGSVEAANSANDEEPSNSDDSGSSDPSFNKAASTSDNSGGGDSGGRKKSPASTQAAADSDAKDAAKDPAKDPADDSTVDPADDKTGSTDAGDPAKPKSGKTGLIVGGLAAAALITALVLKGKKKEKPTPAMHGLSGVAKKAKAKPTKKKSKPNTQCKKIKTINI